MMPVHASFGPLLKHWRATRGFSQERLAAIAEVSSRHVSFLETGRSAPSREMVLVLANALDMPLRDRNTLLGAAGYASVYRASEIDSPALAAVRRAFDHLLRAHEPEAAMLVDRLWNVRAANGGAARLLAWMSEGTDPCPASRGNIVHALFDPKALRAYVINWDEIAGLIVERMHREIALEPDDDDRRRLLASLLAYPDVPARFRLTRAGDSADPFVAMHVRRGDVDLRFLTTLTTLGTPLDITAQELRIESYFSADDATHAFVHALAAAATPAMTS